MKRLLLSILMLALASCGAENNSQTSTTVTISLAGLQTSKAVTTAVPASVQSMSVEAISAGGVVIAGPVIANAPNLTALITVPNANGVTFKVLAFDALDGAGTRIYESKSAPVDLNGLPVSVPVTLSLSVGVSASAGPYYRNSVVNLTGTVAGVAPVATSPLLWTATGGTLGTAGANGVTNTWTTPNLPGSYTVTANIDRALNPDQDPAVVGTVVLNVVNQAPVLTLSATAVTIEQGLVDSTVTASATDADGDAVTYSLAAGTPAWATINATTGVVTISPTVQNPAASYAINVIATDALGMASTAKTVNVTIIATDVTPPVVTAPASITVATVDIYGTPASDAAIVAFLAGATATDNVGVVSQTNDAYATTQFPMGVTTVIFSAADAKGNIGTASATVTVSDLTVPVITLLGASPVTVIQGQAYTDAGVTVADNIDTGLVATMTGTVNTAVVGAYTLTYNVTDTAGNVAVPVTRTVNVVNNAPVIAAPVNPYAFTLPEDTVAQFPVSASDPDGHALSYAITTPAINGVASIDVYGGVTYTPALNFNGTDTFVIQVQDSYGAIATPLPVNITVTPVNDAPVITSPIANPYTLAAPGSFTVTATDPDAGQLLTYSITPQAANGTAVVDAYGNVSYSPNGGFSGLDTFGVQVSDPYALFDQRTINVNVATVIQVTDTLGTPISGVDLNVYDVYTDTYKKLGVTDASGMFNVNDPYALDPNGQYILVADTGTLPFASGYWTNMINANGSNVESVGNTNPPFIWTPSQMSPVMMLEPGVTLSGQITDHLGVPVPFAEVKYSNNPNFGDFFTFTDPSGNYATGVIPQIYVIGASGMSLDSYGKFRPITGGEAGGLYAENRDAYGNLISVGLTPYGEMATPVDVTVPKALNMQLVLGTHLSGTVIDSYAVPVANLDVGLDMTFFRSTTDPTGFYELNVQAGGPFYIRTSDKIYPMIGPELPLPNNSIGGYASTMSTMVTPFIDMYSSYNFTAGVPMQVNMQLIQGAVVTGIVADSVTAAPIAGAEVIVRDYYTDMGWGVTDINGNYSIAVPAGSYQVMVRDNYWDQVTQTNQPLAGGYVGGFIDPYGSLIHNQMMASWYTVTLGQTTVANALMTQGGTITGTVLTSDGYAAAGISVELRDDYTFNYFGTSANADGSFAMNVPLGLNLNLFIGNQIWDNMTQMQQNVPANWLTGHVDSVGNITGDPYAFAVYNVTTAGSTIPTPTTNLGVNVPQILITTQPGFGLTDGYSGVNIIAHMQDSLGVPMWNQQVDFAVTGGATISPTMTYTGGEGDAFAYINDFTAEIVTVTVSSPIVSPQQVNVEFMLASSDADADGLIASDEYIYGTNPNNADTDGDGLNDGQEILTYGTDPLFPDIDGDGLTDAQEVLTYMTNPYMFDTDGDGLSDGQEVLTYGTDPLVFDTDGDGLSDGQEVAVGSNPLLWGSLQTSGVAVPLNDSVWDGAQFVVVGGSATEHVLTSTDSINWTIRNSAAGSPLQGVDWNGTTYVAVGMTGAVRTSADAITWVAQTSPTANTLSSVIWTGTEFVATGGTISSGEVHTSVDGVTWAQSTITSVQNLNGVTFGLVPPTPTPTYVVVGNGGEIQTSADAITWVAQTSGTANALQSVIWGNNEFVAVGQAGTILTSPDGITWTPQTSPNVTTWLDDVMWDSITMQYFAVGRTPGAILTSPDGINWVEYPSEPGNYTSISGTGLNAVLTTNTGSIYTLP